MATFVYPFIKDGNGKYRPMIPINIINPIQKGLVSTYALLDTGADACVFPKGIADITKHELKGDTVASSVTQGVGGTPITVWNHTFRVELINPEKTNPVWKSKEILIACLDHNNAPVLLGWACFMEHLKITFNYPTKKIVIEVP